MLLYKIYYFKMTYNTEKYVFPLKIKALRDLSEVKV